MFLASQVRNFLDSHRVLYEVQVHGPAQTLQQVAQLTGISSAEIVRAVVVRQRSGKLLMLVLPLDHVVDFAALTAFLGSEVELVIPESLDSIFFDCALGAIPPLGQAYGLETFIDVSLAECEQIFFEPGERSALIRVSGRDFFKLHQELQWVSISAPEHQILGNIAQQDGANMDAQFAVSNLDSFVPALEIKRRVEQVYELPPMPDMAISILKLKNNSDATMLDLSRLVEMDPSLAAQVIRYASSPFFGYGGKISTIKEAIARVLGYDLVMNIALGICTAKAFRNPLDGPLGLRAYWRHATYAAALAQLLARALPKNMSVNPGMAYLAGLLHNFGFLLLGHLFQPEFFLLNKVVASHPEMPITAIERQVLGMGQAKDLMVLGHASIGAWLMEAWNMPQEIVVSVREHHDEQYDGEHALYAKLVFLANVLLKANGIGESTTAEIPPLLLVELGISEKQALQAMQEILSAAQHLDAMAQQFAA